MRILHTSAASISVSDTFIIATATVSFGHTEGHSVGLSYIRSPIKFDIPIL